MTDEGPLTASPPASTPATGVAKDDSSTRIVPRSVTRGRSASEKKERSVLWPMAGITVSALMIVVTEGSKEGLKRFASSKTRLQRTSSMPLTLPLATTLLGPHEG